MVMLLITDGADINSKDNQGQTSLYTALIFHRDEIAKLLISRNIDINSTSNEGKTALHIAAKYNFLQISELLINKGADINARDKDGWTALDHAIWNIAQKSDEAIVDMLIAKGAKVSTFHSAVFLEDKQKVLDFIKKRSLIGFK
jgi:ankyrin repeat protein